VKPGEDIYVIGNGFGPTDVPLTGGSPAQTGSLFAPLPVVKIGGVPAIVSSAELTGIGTYQIRLTVPGTLPDGELLLSATYNGSSTQPNVLIAVQH
jgi:uncharacterized protein (TIGR03437 family)